MSADRRSVVRGMFLATGIGLALTASGTPLMALAAEKSPPVVTLVVDYGDGVEKHFRALAWREGITVLDLTESAAKHPRGIRFEHRGRGATAFLLQIDDLKNEGRGRNWIYRINGELADRGFAVQVVKPNDRVVWQFAEYRQE